MFGNIGQIGELLRNAGKIREQMEKAAEELGRLRVEGSSGGGAVTCAVNGHFELLEVQIDPKFLAPDQKELLEDLIVAAVGQATQKAREEAGRSFSGMAGGLPIPGMSGLFGDK